ncbi:carbohydrate ABC transporter permease [Acidisoma sp.]|uniref:carbohydrate ABC transporter permease n=1 Tax=Acidisoma sp. TaxID=1872115 RepID=UPI003B00E705
MSISAAGDRVAARPRRLPLKLAAKLAPLVWVGPAMALIVVVVLWPVVIMIETAFQHISPDGFILGWAGWRNFVYLREEPDLVDILVRTGIWVGTVVVGTMLISLALCQLFNQKFPGRRIARWALIAPWAASVVMTAIVFRWGLDANNGIINVLLYDLGLLHRFNSDAADWLGTPGSALVWMIVVAIYVSVPFSTYALLAGLQAIPSDVYEAARVDGAGVWRTYFTITLPLLRPAFIVALLINVMNVFNSFPIIWEMTRGGPGHQTSTTTTFMYQLKESYIGESAAMSVVNFGLVVVIVAIYLRVTVWKREPA